jgi:hypothetical protein
LRAGADAQTGEDDVDPELPALQLTGDGPAAGRRFPAPGGDLGFQVAEPAAVAQQDARICFGPGLYKGRGTCAECSRLGDDVL